MRECSIHSYGGKLLFCPGFDHPEIVKDLHVGSEL